MSFISHAQAAITIITATSTARPVHTSRLGMRPITCRAFSLLNLIVLSSSIRTLFRLFFHHAEACPADVPPVQLPNSN